MRWKQGLLSWNNEYFQQLTTLMILRLLTLIKQDIQAQQQIISLYSECFLIETDCLSHNIYWKTIKVLYWKIISEVIQKKIPLTKTLSTVFIGHCDLSTWIFFVCFAPTARGCLAIALYLMSPMRRGRVVDAGYSIN